MVVDIVALGQSRVLNKVGEVMVGLMLRLSVVTCLKATTEKKYYCYDHGQRHYSHLNHPLPSLPLCIDQSDGMVDDTNMF